MPPHQPSPEVTGKKIWEFIAQVYSVDACLNFPSHPPWALSAVVAYSRSNRVLFALKNTCILHYSYLFDRWEEVRTLITIILAVCEHLDTHLPKHSQSAGGARTTIQEGSREQCVPCCLPAYMWLARPLEGVTQVTLRQHCQQGSTGRKGAPAGLKALPACLEQLSEAAFEDYVLRLLIEWCLPLWLSAMR